MTAAPLEFDLVAACCRWPRTAQGAELVQALADREPDWKEVLRLSRRHRVWGFVDDGLRRAGVQPPEAAAQVLKTQAAAVARNALLRVAEAARLQALLTEAGLTGLFIKGESLAMRVYGGLTLKQAWDIDLLVPPEDAAAAWALLRAEGYEMVDPPAMGPERFADFVGLSRECLMRHGPSGIAVELHWRLLDDPWFMPGVCARSPAQAVVVGPKTALNTLNDPDLFAYLCLHGAQHGWSRLKWLVDVAAWVAQEDAAGVERLYAQAEERRAGRAMGQGLLLARRLLGLELPPALAARLEGEPALRRLEQAALRAIGQEQAVLPGSAAAFAIAGSHVLLAEGWAYRLAMWRRRWRGEWDRVHIPLPRPLHFLYPLIRAPSWMLRRLRRANGGTPT